MDYIFSNPYIIDELALGSPFKGIFISVGSFTLVTPGGHEITSLDDFELYDLYIEDGYTICTNTLGTYTLYWNEGMNWSVEPISFTL